jgi:hypothetical protein
MTNDATTLTFTKKTAPDWLLPDDRSSKRVKPVMTHFFYMDEANPTNVRPWTGAVGPIAF